MVSKRVSANINKSSDKLNSLKLLAALAILIAGIVGFYYLEEQALWMRLLVVIGGTVVGALVAMQSEVGQATWHFFTSSRTELRKVVWPTRQDTLQTTLIVFVVVVLVGLFLWLVDMALLSIVRSLTG